MRSALPMEKGNKKKKKVWCIDTWTEKLGLDRLGSLKEYPGSSAFLLYGIEQTG